MDDYDEYEGIAMGDIDATSTNIVMGCLVMLIALAVIGFIAIIYSAFF